MPMFLCVASAPIDLPGDGTRPSMTVQPGETVDAETNPAPTYFDEVKAAPESKDE